MARTGITYDQVELAAETILQKGENPTIERIRCYLGTGSSSTIARHLTSWRSSRLVASPNILPALQTPPDPVNEAVKKVWQQIQAENDAKLHEIEQAAENQIKHAQLAKDEAFQLKERFEQDNADLRQLLKEERIKFAEQEKELIRLKRELGLEQQKAQQLESQLIEVKRLHKEHLQDIQTASEKVEMHYQAQIQEWRVRYEEDINELKDFTEEQRHQSIVKIDNLQVENSKLRIALSEQQVIAMVLEKQNAQQESQHQANYQKLEAMQDLLKAQHRSSDNLLKQIQQTPILVKNMMTELIKANQVDLLEQMQIQSNQLKEFLNKENKITKKIIKKDKRKLHVD